MAKGLDTPSAASRDGECSLLKIKTMAGIRETEFATIDYGITTTTFEWDTNRRHNRSRKSKREDRREMTACHERFDGLTTGSAEWIENYDGRVEYRFGLPVVISSREKRKSTIDYDREPRWESWIPIRSSRRDHNRYLKSEREDRLQIHDWESRLESGNPLDLPS